MHRSFIVIALLLAGSGPALSQDATARDDAAERRATIDEITVTARKRAESAQDVPISMTAFSGDSLEQIGATELIDILHRTPNFYQPYLGEAKGTPPSIRGVVGTSTAGADPAVGVYVDEVYLGNTVASSFDLFDLESFEVLRGPQGTLFGRNTIAGVINVRTRSPGNEPEGSISASYGNYANTRLRGYVSGPLVDGKLFGKISAVSHTRDGFIENVNPGHGDLRELDNWFVRSQLRYVPGDNTDITLSVDYRDVSQRGGGYKADGQNVYFSGTLPGTEFLTYTPGDPLEYEVDWDCCGEEELEAWGVAIDVRHQLPGMELRSITAYREHSYYSIFDTDLSPNAWLSDGSPEEQQQLSQEVRLTSAGDGPFTWIAGLYYFRQESTDLNFARAETDLLTVLGFPPGTPAVIAQANGVQDADSMAGYLHVDYDLTDRLGIAVGGRLTHDSKTLDYVQVDDTGLLGGGFATTGDDSWTEFTGDASLSYSLTTDAMAYVTVARGYKAGGFNDGVGQADNPPFDPEYVMSYEAGLKSAWFDNRAVININGYYLDWRDIQVAGFRRGEDNSFRRVTGNFGDATSRGIEAELAVRPAENFEMTANAGFSDGDSRTVSDNGLVSSSSLTGPDYTFNVSARYEQALGNGGRLTWFGDVVVQGDNDLIPPDAVPAGVVEGPEQERFALLNARATYTSPNERWSLSLWGKNILDKTYKTQYFSFDGNPLLTPGALVLGEPRMYGAEVRVNF